MASLVDPLSFNSIVHPEWQGSAAGAFFRYSQTVVVLFKKNTFNCGSKSVCRPEPNVSSKIMDGYFAMGLSKLITSIRLDTYM